MRSLSEEGVVLSGIAIDRDPLRTSQATSADFLRGERNGKELATKERLVGFASGTRVQSLLACAFPIATEKYVRCRASLSLRAVLRLGTLYLLCLVCITPASRQRPQ